MYVEYIDGEVLGPQRAKCTCIVRDLFGDDIADFARSNGMVEM